MKRTAITLAALVVSAVLIVASLNGKDDRRQAQDQEGRVAQGRATTILDPDSFAGACLNALSDLPVPIRLSGLTSDKICFCGEAELDSILQPSQKIIAGEWYGLKTRVQLEYLMRDEARDRANLDRFLNFRIAHKPLARTMDRWEKHLKRSGYECEI